MNTLSITSSDAPALHIALVTETYLPEVNGVAITLGRMVKGMLERGHRIHLIRPRQGRHDSAQQQPGFEETLLPGMPIPGYPELKAGLPSKGKLLRLWQAQRPDIVHIATEGPLGWSAAAAARRLSLPVCTDFHTNFHSYSEHYGIGLLKKPIAAYLRHFHNKTDGTLVPTETLQQELAQAGYRGLHVVARGVDTGLFHPGKRSDDLRRLWGADETTPVVMLVSRMAPEKNLQLVIDSFREMQRLNPDLRLVMVGDGPARAALQQAHPDIVFTGMKTGEELAAHYASGDIFLYPSLTETYGNVTVEAMASGLAVIAYDYAAARQHIRHEVNGLLAPYNNANAFIVQATGLASDWERIRRLRLAARATAEALGWDQVMRQLEQALRNIVSRKGVQHVQTELATATD